jgi:hypothetical protein
MFKKYKLNSILIDKKIHDDVLLKLNEIMNNAAKFGQDWFDLSFEIKDFLKKSWFSKININNIQLEIITLESMKQLRTICQSRNWLYTFDFNDTNNIEKLILTITIRR